MDSRTHDLHAPQRSKATRSAPKTSGLTYRAATAERAEVLNPLIAEEHSSVLDVVNSGGGAPMDVDTRMEVVADKNGAANLNWHGPLVTHFHVDFAI